MNWTFARSCWIACLTLALCVPCTTLTGADSSRTNKPVFLYSRYFNAEGENRYLPDGNYKDVLSRLRTDFEVRIDNKPLTPQNLTDVKLVLIANPSDKAVGQHPAPVFFDLDRDSLVACGIEVLEDGRGRGERHLVFARAAAVDDPNAELSHLAIR